MADLSLLFDLDGTLIDSAPDIHATAVRVLEGEGLAPLSFAETRSFVGKGVPHLVDRLIEASGLDPDPERAARMVARFMREYETAFDLTRPYPGVETVLRDLAAAGHPMAVVTNKPLSPTRAVLRHFGWEPLFRVVLGGDSLPTRKPDPAMLHTAAASLGGKRAVMVGDSEEADGAARELGCGFVLVDPLPTTERPDGLLRGLRDYGIAL